MLEVSKAQRNDLEALRHDFGIRLILAFGSLVKGNPHARSDLDIGVLMESTGGISLELFQKISAVFASARVDIAHLNRADPLLLKEVSANPLLLAGAEDDLQEFRIYSFRRYAEYHPYFQLEAQTNQRHLALLHNGP
jgi:predicted nucleotidyltransferase